MSAHPNVILMAVLTPDGLSRATMRDILAECKLNSSEYIEVAGASLHPMVMESDYHDGYQISAREGRPCVLRYGHIRLWKGDRVERVRQPARGG